MVGDQRGGLRFAVAKFRVFVNLVANVGDLRRKSLDRAVDVGMLCVHRRDHRYEEGERADQ